MKNKIIYNIKYNFVVRNVVLAISLILIIGTSSFLLLDIYTKHGEKFVIPNLSGLTMKEAKKLVAPMDSRFVIIDSMFIPSQKAGVILEQNPKAGSYIKSNRRVLLTVNTMSPRKISMPYVAGYSLRQAKNKLLGLGIGISNIIFREDIATNNVIAQKHNGMLVEQNSGDMIAIGDELELIVGLAPNEPPSKVPNIVGFTLSMAKSILWESGFNVGNVVLDNDINHNNIDDAMIYSQSTLPTILIPHGARINISATLDKNKVSEMVNKINDRQNNIEENQLDIDRYIDTLKMLRDDDGRGIITVDGIITAQDSMQYSNKLFDLELLRTQLINNLVVKQLEYEIKEN